MKFTWFTTASILLETKNSHVLFDPYIPIKGSNVRISREDYNGYRNIVITHGHLDHIGSLNQLKDVDIYGTGIVCKNAEKGLGVKVNQITPYQTLVFGDIKVTGYPTVHVKFDLPLILKTFMNRDMWKYRENILPLYHQFKDWPENNEILGYLVEAEGKRVFVLGSLGLKEDVKYPEDVDVLVLPYQGNSQLNQLARNVINRLKPKKVILDHFDNSFPPLSSDIDTKEIEDIAIRPESKKVLVV